MHRMLALVTTERPRSCGLEPCARCLALMRRDVDFPGRQNEPALSRSYRWRGVLPRITRQLIAETIALSMHLSRLSASAG